MAKNKTALPLLKLLEPEQKPTYELLIEPVPFKLSVSSDERFWIVSVRKIGDEVVARYQLPVQWTLEEAGELIQHIRGVGWQLKEDAIYEGRPHCNDDIDFVCEQFCKQRRLTRGMQHEN
jgi:hypothetical protein